MVWRVPKDVRINVPAAIVTVCLDSAIVRPDSSDQDVINRVRLAHGDLTVWNVVSAQRIRH